MSNPVKTALTQDLVTWFNAHWKPRLQTLDGHDLRFLDSLMIQAQAEMIVEIGCGSGFSTAVLAMLQDTIGPATLHSFDISTFCSVTPQKPVGYLCDLAGDTADVDVFVHPATTSLDIPETLDGLPIDICFIDAQAAHPWPTIDALLVLPYLRDGAVVVVRNLSSFRQETLDTITTGPKILLDQVPVVHRIWPSMRPKTALSVQIKARNTEGNVFAFRVPKNTHAMAWSLCQGLYLGWDGPIAKEHVYQIRSFLEFHYQDAVQQAFDVGLARYNGVENMS